MEEVVFKNGVEYLLHIIDCSKNNDENIFIDEEKYKGVTLTVDGYTLPENPKEWKQDKSNLNIYRTQIGDAEFTVTYKDKNLLTLEMKKGKEVKVVEPVGIKLSKYVYYHGEQEILSDEKSIDKAIKLTASFEGGTVTGNFDGQGMSLGILQWNIGRGTLQPLLNDFVLTYPIIAKSIFLNKYLELKNILQESIENQLYWAKNINNNKNQINNEWKPLFSNLLKSKEFMNVQKKYTQSYINTAFSMIKDYKLTTERSLALCFDIGVQNGSIGKIGRKELLEKLKNNNLSEKETQIFMAKATSEKCNPDFKKDVLTRKMTIVNGIGEVHGRKYDLLSDFNITDNLIKGDGK